MSIEYPPLIVGKVCKKSWFDRLDDLIRRLLGRSPVIYITSGGEYNFEPEEIKIYGDMSQRNIWMVLYHEYMHHLLYELEGEEACRRFDNLHDVKINWPYGWTEDYLPPIPRMMIWR